MTFLFSNKDILSWGLLYVCPNDVLSYYVRKGSTMSTNIVSTPKESWFINRNFVLLWIGQSISSIGDFFFSTTLTLWVATQLAKGQSWTPLAVSGVAMANVVPLLLVGPIAGVFVIGGISVRRCCIWMYCERSLLHCCSL